MTNMQGAIDRFASETREKREALVRAMADIGKASGLEAAAKVILSLAGDKGRVVGTSELKAAAETLSSIAADIRAKAEKIIGMKS